MYHDKYGLAFCRFAAFADNIKSTVQQEEDKLKIMWGPADIERWLQTGVRSSSTQRAIEIDSYEVTIFPAESVKVIENCPFHFYDIIPSLVFTS